MALATDVEQSQPHHELDQLCINSIRVLVIDAVQKANSGHPGMPMGTAPIGYLLFTRFLRHNPANPKWYGRDRFVLSAGHGSMLLYSLLYLTGYDLSLEEIKRFRQLGSHTPGHPEYGCAPGVETTTGPLGQGFGTGVGMAIAAQHMRELFERDGSGLFDHRIFAIASDGDMMEGISSEAASLAGHLGLGNLIYLYDDNHITIDGHTEITFTEDVCKRFDAYGWHTQAVEDGNDLAALSVAIERACAETQRPSLIRVRTHIGYGSPHRQDTSEAHGKPLGVEEVKLTKKFYGWPLEPDFYVPDEALNEFRKCRQRGRRGRGGVEPEAGSLHGEVSGRGGAVQGDGCRGASSGLGLRDPRVYTKGQSGDPRVGLQGRGRDRQTGDCGYRGRRRPQRIDFHRYQGRWRFRAATGSPAAICTSASASTPCVPYSMGSRCTVDWCRWVPRSWYSATTRAARFGWPP